MLHSVSATVKQIVSLIVGIKNDAISGYTSVYFNANCHNLDHYLSK